MKRLLVAAALLSASAIAACAAGPGPEHDQFQTPKHVQASVTRHVTPRTKTSAGAKPRVGIGKSPPTYIDPDTGMSCQNFGGVAVCGPPQGTVHYRNDKGLNCTRTGIMAVCTSF